MRILLLGEYSNVHNTLAIGLRELGHTVTVVSNGDFWKNYPRDIDLARRPGLLGGICLLLKVLLLLPRLRNYDIVQFINPIFFELKAHRLVPIFRYLKKHNRRLVLGAYGMDHYWVSTNITQMPLRYSDFNIGKQLRNNPEAIKEQHEWLGTDKEYLNKLMARECHGIIAGLYEYLVSYTPHYPQKTTFIPYPIIIHSTHINTFSSIPYPINIFIGISRNRSHYKGTDIMLHAAQTLRATYPDKVKLTIAEGLPFEEYTKKMNGADIILDQLYSYTPSMNPLEAMSRGIICVGGGEPENYQILNEPTLRPIINVEPTYESCLHQLEQLINHPERIPKLKKQSIAYIVKHHNHKKIARQYEQFYLNLLQNR